MIPFVSSPVGNLNEHLKTLSCHLLQNPLSLRYHTVVSHRKNRRPCILSCLKWGTNASTELTGVADFTAQKSQESVALLDTSVTKHVLGCVTPEVPKIEHLKQIWTINSLNHFWATLSCLGVEDVKHSPILQTAQPNPFLEWMSQSRWSRRQLL